jgi:hypothetical protein
MGDPINYSDADEGDVVPNGADRYFPVVIDEAAPVPRTVAQRRTDHWLLLEVVRH